MAWGLLAGLVMVSRLFVVSLFSVAACSTAGADGAPGYETGPCIDGGCFEGLACLSDLCVASGDDDDDGGPGGLDVTGISDSATTPGMTSDPGESTASDPSSPTSPTSLTGNATADDTTGPGSASAESADETPPDDGTTTGTSSGGDPCGNGEVEPGEQCDGNNLQGFDCASLGLGMGDLECDPITCSFDTSMCVPTTSGTSG